MKITIGSKNPTKIKAVQDVFKTAEITSLDVLSGVSAQPFSDEETRTGAINRATSCAKSIPNSVGIGLEGRVMYIEDQLFLCNWGALVRHDHSGYTACGAWLLMPNAIP